MGFAVAGWQKLPLLHRQVFHYETVHTCDESCGSAERNETTSHLLHEAFHRPSRNTTSNLKYNPQSRFFGGVIA